MARRSIKFIWGASRVIRGHWYLGLFGFYDRHGEREGGLAISVRGILLWLGTLALAAYVAGAAVLYSIWQRNSHSLLTFTDALFYPVRRTEISTKHGQAFIAQGTDLFRAKKYHDAASLLRLGLARFPHDFAARLKLAQYYELTNQRSTALRILAEGLTDEFPGRAYLETMFSLAGLADDHDIVANVAGRYLPRLGDGSSLGNRRWLQGRQFAALLAAERPAEALALAEADELGDTTSEYRVLALLALGRPDDAIAFLTNWRSRPGADLKVVTRLDVRARREAKRFDAMERALTELRALAPADPAPYIYGVVQQAMAGRAAAAEAALDAYFFRFGGSAENLLLVAEPLAEIANLPLLQRCIAAARERGYPPQRFSMLLVQTLVQCGEWQEANRALALLPPAGGPGAAQIKVWRDWIQLLVDAAGAASESASQPLLELFRGRRWPLSVYRLTNAALIRAGRLEPARDILAMGVAAFPASRLLQAEAQKVAAAIAARPAPSQDAGAAAAPAWLFVEQQFSQRLNETLRQRQWEEAARLIREVRSARPTPSWLESKVGDLDLAQVRIYQAQENIGGVIASAQSYLNGDETRARTLLEIAREFFGQGDRPAAVGIAREILRRSPRHVAAQRALSEWQPPPQKTAAPPVPPVKSPGR